MKPQRVGRRASAILIIGVASALALTGCTTTKTVVQTTPGPTITVTPKPTAVPRSTDDPLTPLDAWLACSAIAHARITGPDDPAGGVWLPYDPKDVELASDGTFMVVVGFAPTKGFGVTESCVLSGTVGQLVVHSTSVLDAS